MNPEEAEFLPLGFDEFYLIDADFQEDNIWMRLVRGVENAIKPMLVKLKNWTEEQKTASEVRKALLKKEMDLLDAELSLKEAIKELDEELKMLQKEEEKLVEQGVEEEDTLISASANELEKTSPEAEDEVNEDDDEEDNDTAPSSFGSIEDENTSNNPNEPKSGKSTFAASSLSFAHSTPLSSVASKLQQSFPRWKELKLMKQTASPSIPLDQFHHLPIKRETPSSISFPCSVDKSFRLRYSGGTPHVECLRATSRFRRQSKKKTSNQSFRDLELFNILSLHAPMPM